MRARKIVASRRSQSRPQTVPRNKMPFEPVRQAHGHKTVTE
jgi:hypothetical protein